MAQETVNTILDLARTVDGAIDLTCLQGIGKLPEYIQLSSEEKNAFSQVDIHAVRKFFESASTRRTNSKESVQQL